MVGYVRQSAAQIANGVVIDPAALNAEFNALRDTFNLTTGHVHDGTTGNGPKLDLTASTTGNLGIARGGTGASDATTARTNLSAQTLNSALTSISGLTTSANQTIYTTASNAYATTALTAYGRTLIDDADASTALSTLGITTFVKTILDDTDAPTVRTTIGLGNVDNTSDINKPVSTAQSSTLAPKASPTFTGAVKQSVFNAGTATTGTVTFDFLNGNKQSFNNNGNITYAFSNIPTDGSGELEILILFTSGTITFPTLKWAVGDGSKTTNVADLGITLVAGQSYRLILQTFNSETHAVIS